MDEKRADIGIIVGRFQVDKLHEAHIELIDSIVDTHPKVIIFLGLSQVLGGIANPLDFEARKQMLLEAYPSINVLYIKDEPSDEHWSENLDAMIKDLKTPNQSACLYGSRDCFVDHYHGTFPTKVLESKIYISGTQIRESISKRVKSTQDFRTGAIWSAFNHYPTCYPTVDVAVLNADNTEVLLGRKKNREKYCFIGGFAEPESQCFEHDARREVTEETGVEITDPVYVGSFKVQDWRYKNEIDKIKTLFFKATYLFGHAKAADDIIEVKWFKLKTLESAFDHEKMTNSLVVSGHEQLLAALLLNLIKDKS